MGEASGSLDLRTEAGRFSAEVRLFTNFATSVEQVMG